MADFTGFYLDGIHSSTYGILRVSDGDRYIDGLIPEFEDFTVELTGGNGDLYGGRRFRPTEFTIEIAFDHMTESQLHGLRKWLGGEKLKEFRFDERPYKAYWVKVAERPELEYVCFMEDADNNFTEKERIYKGEGEIEFIAYDPFGYCVDNSYSLDLKGRTENKDGINWQELNTYLFKTKDSDNINEWAIDSGLKSNLSSYGFSGGGNVAKLYNPGDFEADFMLRIEDTAPHVTDNIVIECVSNKVIVGELKFRPIENSESLDGILIYFLNTKNHSLQVGRKKETEGKIELITAYRYDLIYEGNWFKIPVGNSELKVYYGSSEGNKFNACDIKYSYKYY